MKIVILIACIVALVHAEQKITGKVFRDYLKECEKESSKEPLKESDPTLIHCASRKIGFFEDDHPTDKNRISVFCKYLISDPTNAAQCINVAEKCFDEVYKDIGNINEANVLSQKIKFANCSLTNGVIALFDS